MGPTDQKWVHAEVCLYNSTECLTDTMNVDQNDDGQQTQQEEQQPPPVINAFDNDNNVHVLAMHQAFMHLHLSPKNKLNTKQYMAAGNAKTNTDLTVAGLKPPVFLQNLEHTCAFNSLASGLMHMNDKKASDFILQHIESSEDLAEAIVCAMMLLTGRNFRYSAKIYKSGMGALKFFDDISCSPTVVRLKSSDGSAGHCITIVGLWVFDSKKVEAVPLSYEFLDWCCSTDTGKKHICGCTLCRKVLSLQP
jgi:hypothetical protein